MLRCGGDTDTKQRKIKNNTKEEWSLRSGVLFVLECVAWVVCLRGWRASVGDVGGVGGALTWLAC